MRTNLRVEMVNPNRFYTYAYLREDRTPYYIGKGCRGRIYSSNRTIRKPKNKSRIIFLKQNLTEEEAFKHEIYMISVFGRKDLGNGILHNKTDGGEGTSGAIVGGETKRKIGEARKGEKHPLYGKSHSKETKRKIGEALKGEKHPLYGKQHSEETKIKITEKATGRFHSDESKRKMGEQRRGKNHPMYGKSHSEETKRKQSEVKRGKKWWNDGNGNRKHSKECPGDGWKLGMK